MASGLIRLIVADDHKMVVSGIKAAFSGTNVAVIDSTEDPFTVISLYQLHKPDIVLCDIRFGDNPKGMDVLKEILNFDGAAKVIMFSHFDDAVSILTAYQRGARAFLSKSMSHHALIKAINLVQDGALHIEPGAAFKLAKLAIESALPSLSEPKKSFPPTEIQNRIADKDFKIEQNFSDVRSDEFRLLINRLDEAMEADRKFIAMQLHDDIGASLVAIQFRLNFLKSELEERDILTADESNQFANMLNHLKEVYENIRRIGKNLRPEMLDVLGLKAALTALINEYNRVNNLKIYFSFDENLNGIDNEMSLTIYRIVQEGITNIIKHANATEVFIVLNKESNYLHLSIIDNGEGFDTHKRPGIGLIGIREKANAMNGEFVIESGIREGTSLSIVVPLPANSES